MTFFKRKIASFLKYKTTEDVVRFYFQNKIRLQLKKYFRGCDVVSKRRISRKNSFTQNNKQGSEVSLTVTPRTGNSPEISWLDYNESPTFKSGQVDSGRESSRSSSPGFSWTFEEVEKLVDGMKRHGTNFKLIAKEIGTKTAMQCRAYWKHNRNTLNVDMTIQNTPKEVQEPKVERKRRRRKILEWSLEEKDTFEKYFRAYGCNWDRLAELIPTKTSLQIRTYYEERMAASRLDLETERAPLSLDLQHSLTRDVTKEEATDDYAHTTGDTQDENHTNQVQLDTHSSKELVQENFQADTSEGLSGESNTAVYASPSQSISAVAEPSKEVLEAEQRT